ncbi:hypothetical protein M3Y98_00640200 [Aphelenchoides besseyi]|nr:hypothetical protein M3Y98_00640200 [Aphelenchoides besseyi]KAI6208561.1 hypothetical protein M3Y96_00128200 [Aphelenchoides besseyi]
MAVEFEEDLKSPETGRSRRQSPIELELKNYSNQTPEFRCTTSVIALLALTTGMVLITSGACILVFFVDVEPTIFPLGLTLGALGLLLFLIGSMMWCSEFMCNDCLGRTYVKLKEAPLKNAIERRSRMASRTTMRTQSRLSQISKVSQRTNETIVSLPPKF